MKNTLYNLLNKELQPESLEISDISYQHAGHNEAAKLGETHFHIKIISKEFKGLSTLKKHRLVMDILSKVITKIHAISLDLSNS